MTWTVSETFNFAESKRSYNDRLDALSSRANWYDDGSAEEFLSECSANTLFDERMQELIESRADPKRFKHLTPAREFLILRIPGFYELRVGPLYGFFWRDSLNQMAIAVLFFHERDRPKELKATLEWAAASR